MAKRHFNPRLAKLHRSYTVEEIASLYGVHRKTVREWIKRGLPTCDDRRPTLILGPDLFTFLQGQRAKNKRPCQPGEIYCFRCRAPRMPGAGMAEYRPETETLGMLSAICPGCAGMMYQRISLAKLERIRGQLDITMPQALPRIGESAQPFVNRDFG